MFPRPPSIGDLPQELALFPLPGVLLLPRARLPLHIFEPRYLAMINDCLKHPHRMIGMISTLGAKEDETQLAAIGCAGRITQFSELDDGRLMITLQGLSRFRVTSEIESFSPYRRFHVEWSEFARDLGAAEQDPALDRDRLWTLMDKLLVARGSDQDWRGLEAAPDEVLINALSMLCPLPPEDRQALLEAPTLAARRDTLFTLIEFALHSGSTDEVLQ